MPAKRRIVHLISSLESGGCENMLLRTLPLLQDEGYEHVVVTLFRPGELAPMFRTRGVRQLSVGGFGRLLPLLKKIQPALIITYLFHADMVGRLWVQPRLPVPVIPFLRTTYNFSRYWPARLMERATRRLVRRYLANSTAVKGFYVREIGVAADRISVLPNGIEMTVFAGADPQPLLDELRLPGQRFVITCVANLAPNKGHRVLLDAFATLAATRSDCCLLLVGQGSEEMRLRQQAAASAAGNQVYFLGRRRDVPAILAVSDAFVLPTLFEGMSNAIQEAMAARLPVITTAIPENEALITDRETGLLVAPGMETPIREALEQLYGDKRLRDSLGRAAAISISERFGMPVVLNQWRQFLREAAV